jgi:hypothetical protein
MVFDLERLGTQLVMEFDSCFNSDQHSFKVRSVVRTKPRVSPTTLACRQKVNKRIKYVTPKHLLRKKDIKYRRWGSNVYTQFGQHVVPHLLSPHPPHDSNASRNGRGTHGFVPITVLL